VRSPFSPFSETTVSPSFLPTVPDRKPRIECACQPVAFIRSFSVAPSERFSKSRILAVLLPSRAARAFPAPLGAFLAGLAFLADLLLAGDTGARRGATGAFLFGFGLPPFAVAGAGTSFFHNRIGHYACSLAVVTAVRDIHHSGGQETQVKSARYRFRGEGIAMTGRETSSGARPW